MKLIKDLGMMYPTENSKRKYRFGIYECEHCSVHFKTQTTYAKSGRTKRCVACKNIKHGDKHTRLYNIWGSMKSRCNDKSHVYYGLKGVTVCDEWRNSYESFREWSLANGYNDELHIDKDIGSAAMNIYPPIYSPKTCTWVTQHRNSEEANGIKTEVNGILYPSKSEASRQTGIDRNIL